MKKILLLIFLSILARPAFCELFFTVKDGPANDPATWFSAGATYPIPRPTDQVVIDHKIVLDIGSPYTHSGNMTIQNGGRLLVRDQFIYAGGLFQILGNSTFQISAPGIDNAFVINSNAIVRNWAFGARILVNNTTAETSILNNGTLDVFFGSLSTSSNLANAGSMTVNPGVEVFVGGLDPVQPIEADFVALTGSQTTLDDGTVRIGGDLIVHSTVPSMICGDGRMIGGQSSNLIFIDGNNGQICSTVRLSREDNPLPIDILSFVIKSNMLEWDVFEERITGYEVQQSDDILSWIAVASIESKGDGRNLYSNKIAKAGYYRLKVISVEEITFSDILYYNGSEEVSFYPSIVKSGMEVTFTGEKLINSVELIGANGVVLNKTNLSSNKMAINQNRGIYFLRISGKNNKVEVSKLVVE